VSVDPSTAVSLEVLAGRAEFEASAPAFVAVGAEVIRDALARNGLRASLESSSTRSKEFEQRLREEILRAKRYDLGLSVIVVRAHQPRLHPPDLRGVASVLKDGLRGSDLVASVGPGALGVMLPHTPAPIVGKVVTRLEQRIVERTAHRGEQWGVGVASLAADCASPGAMIARALRAVRPVMPD
jgi:hypothetical protein